MTSRLSLLVLVLGFAAPISACRPKSTLSRPLGGTIVDNGGDLLRCREDANPSGDFTLDYVVTFDQVVGTTRDPQEADWSTLEARMRRILRDKLPELLPSFESYVAQLRSDDPAGSRIWHASGSALADLDDEDLIAQIPAHCLVERDGVMVPDLRQLVRRRYVTDSGVIKVHYYYDVELLDRLQRERPLQYSYLIVHEWLWDLAETPWANRSVNRLLHDTAIETMTATEVRQALRGFGMSGDDDGLIGRVDPTFETVRALFASEPMCDFGHRTTIGFSPEADRLTLAPGAVETLRAKVTNLDPAVGPKVCGFAFVSRARSQAGGTRIDASFRRGVDWHDFGQAVSGSTSYVRHGACTDRECIGRRGELATMVTPSSFLNSRWSFEVKNEGTESVQLIAPYLVLVRMVE